jgi:ribonuclease D
MDVSWIASTPELESWIGAVDGGPLAVDTEADSFHHYREKICLLQLSAGDRHALIDPFAELDWASLGGVLRDPAVVKIFHGADYDVRLLERDLGLTVRNLYDTSVAARLSGEVGVGLAALLEKHLAVALDKTQQRADWSKRPLTQPMREYAVADTQHLATLAAILAAQVDGLYRTPWVREECARLESVRWRDRQRDDPESFRRVKGSGTLDRGALSVLREIWVWREETARRRDRPVFRVLRDELLVAIAKAPPATIGDLVKLAGFPAPIARSPLAHELVDAVRAGTARPEGELPEIRPTVRIRVEPEVEARIGEIRKERDRVAKELALDPSLIASRATVEEMARRLVDGSDPWSVPDLRAWQAELLRPLVA